MKNYTYELFDKKKNNGITSIKCRVKDLEELQIDYFSLLLDKEGYHAWTHDTIFEKPIRKEIEEELNSH